MMCPTHHSFFARFRIRVVLTTSFLLICLIYILSPTKWTLRDQQQLGLEINLENSPTSTSTSTGTTLPLPTSSLDTLTANEGPSLCAKRYGLEYLHTFSETRTSYCDMNSAASLTCFSNKASDTRTDSFCIGHPALFDSVKKTFELDCNLRAWGDEETAKQIPRLHQFPSYWYNTGPRVIFNQYVKLEGTESNISSLSDSKGFSFLVRREDNNKNLWHRMMEVMSLTMSLDILRTTLDPTTGSTFFNDDDPKQSQIVVLDDLEDGPYYDLWGIFAKKPILRINNAMASDLSLTKIVIPLPGGSNPFWAGDWEDLQCEQSDMLQTFSRRVLDFYTIPDSSPSDKESLTLTLIDRKKKRRLLNQETYFKKLEAKFPNIKMQVVDYAALPFAEQVRITHSTNILLSVHGAGLTHGMFLPHNSTIVEILPPTLMHRGFDNMSKFLGHHYFSRHGSPHDSPDNNGDWQHDDVFIEEERFFEMMEEAIAGMTG